MWLRHLPMHAEASAVAPEATQAELPLGFTDVLSRMKCAEAPMFTQAILPLGVTGVQ